LLLGAVVVGIPRPAAEVLAGLELVLVYLLPPELLIQLRLAGVGLGQRVMVWVIMVVILYFQQLPLRAAAVEVIKVVQAITAGLVVVVVNLLRVLVQEILLQHRQHKELMGLVITVVVVGHHKPAQADTVLVELKQEKVGMALHQL
jgi:hypothetical protein